MKKELAILTIIATFAFFMSSVYLHATEYAWLGTDYGFSVVTGLIKWITTTQADFECSGNANRSHIDTQSSPGDVILEKKIAWKTWWNLSWKYRLRINVINRAGISLTDYQILIILTPETFNYSKANSDGSDIRFTLQKINGEEELSYWIEGWNVSGISKIWVKVTEIPDTNATIYMYYGNEFAESKSDGAETFIFFDDFENSLPWNESGLWHTTSKRWHSSNHSKWYGQETTNNYDTGSRNYGSLVSPQFNGSGNMKLEMWFWREVENYAGGLYDQTIIYDSVDGTTWNEIWYNDSSHASDAQWKFLSIDMTANAKYIRFYFDTIDAFYNDYWGWFIDDVRIRKYVEPEPIVNFGNEESMQCWTDYFGGDSALEQKGNVSIENGNVIFSTHPAHTYDFSFNAGVDRWAYRYQAFDNPPSDDSTPSIHFTPIQYTNIADDDAIMQGDYAKNRRYAAHRFVFQIEENVSDIESINIFWNGIGGNEGSLSGYDGASLYIWNYSSASYELLASTPVEYETNLTATIYNNISHFIDESHRIIILVEQNAYSVRRGGTFLNLSYIATDYICVNVNLYAADGIVVSLPISPENRGEWREFYANATLQGDIDVTFKILNASNNEVICNISYEEAENGYNISFINSSSIKLCAEFTYNGSGTATLHEWGVSWIAAYYSHGYLISCIHDTGNATDFATISWNATLLNKTSVKFQIASSIDGINWTEFVGPDGSNLSYYISSGEEIWNGHDGARYIKYIAYLETSQPSTTPVLHDVTISYYGGG